MDFALEYLGEVVRVAPRGRIDSSTADAFDKQLHQLFEAGRRRLIVDFRDVPYITSAGFRSLLMIDATLGKSDGRMALCGMSKEMHRLFEMGAFTDMFTIVASVDDGLKSLAAPNA